MNSEPVKSRRDFLTHRSANVTDPPTVPVAGNTVRLATRAMACEFSVVMNPGSHSDVPVASDALEIVHNIETWLSIYRVDSELSQINRVAGEGPVPVRRELFELLRTSVRLHSLTDGAFDIAMGRQIQLWRSCRAENRLPTDSEVEAALAASGSQHLRLDADNQTVEFARAGLRLDPGAIGKGYALDEAVHWLTSSSKGPASCLLHGGHSSVVARGQHNGVDGWPVGIGNPLFTQKRLGTVLLKNQALSTSGSNIQFFRVGEKRYGHILDPRTARPVEGMLSVTVLADSAAVADAVSTAFFVLGVENARKYCDNLENVAVILIPFPTGKKVTPTVIGVPSSRIFWDEQQVVMA
ncbi:MAG: FAD:protein FMN transferase [Planctomycetaceae bacterium]|nr:FAD:protein FMN transferase [Planctomycetaceae bacterium]